MNKQKVISRIVVSPFCLCSMAKENVKEYAEYCEYQYRGTAVPDRSWHRAYLTEKAFRQDHPDTPIVKITSFREIQSGDWVRCSNGWVVQCFKANTYTHRGRPFKNCYIGGRRLQGYADGVLKPKFFNWTPAKPSFTRKQITSPEKNFFVELMICGMDPKEAHQTAYKNMWNANPVGAKKHMQRLLGSEELALNVVKLRAENDMTFKEKLKNNELTSDTVVEYMRTVMNDPESTHAARKWACEMILKFEDSNELGAEKYIETPSIDKEALKKEMEERQSKIIKMTGN